MKRETLLRHMFEHGRLTAYHEGERQVVWGVIADVNCDTMRILNHEAELQKFEMKNIKGFRKEVFNLTRKYSTLTCDCGCKSTDRFICEKCGRTFCGTKHGVLIRDETGTALNLCEKCVSSVRP